MDIEIFTDGACRGNPGPGGWGVLLRLGDEEKELWGGEALTTNNRMELLAAIEGLSALTTTVLTTTALASTDTGKVSLTTDSEYVRQGITTWIKKWKRSGWKTSNRKAVKNQDLWERLDHLVAQYQVEWHWVKGHSGHAENERVDALANRGIDEWAGNP